MSPACSSIQCPVTGSADSGQRTVISAPDNSLIDAVPGAVLLLDQFGTIVNANSTALDWLDGPIVGQAWRDVFKRELSQEPTCRELSTRDRRLLNISTRPLGNGPGQVVLLSDVTESRALQDIVDRSSRLAAMGEMTARLSHQIRTPVSTAVLYLTQLQSAALDTETRQKFTRKSLARLQHVEKMIRDMLMFAHGGQMSAEPIAVSELIAELDQQLSPLVESARADYAIDSRTQARVYGNSVGLVTALLNICNNAIENVGDKLQLRISVRDDGSHAVLEISDNGDGIPESLRQRVFQPFFTTRSDGTGLGLPVVKSIIAAHRGQVEIHDAECGGAKFVIVLPVFVASERAENAHAVA